MPQTLSCIYVHIIFSTNKREKLFDDDSAERLWAYIAGICKTESCDPVIIGGSDDHVHILCKLSRDICIKDLVSKLKTSTSKWLKQTYPVAMHNFHWQRGYGIFSINPVEKSIVVEYIANQKEHHKYRSFQEEFLIFLKKYDVSYDEEYLWD